jgi:hypothetical protein
VGQGLVVFQHCDQKTNDRTGSRSRQEAEEKGGEIREVVLLEVKNLLMAVDEDETADEVFCVLDSIDVQDCWDRSGSSRHGYTEPSEAAVELVEEELQPFYDQAKRYRELGMAEQETTNLLHGSDLRNLPLRA